MTSYDFGNQYWKYAKFKTIKLQVASGTKTFLHMCKEKVNEFQWGSNNHQINIYLYIGNGHVFNSQITFFNPSCLSSLHPLIGSTSDTFCKTVFGCLRQQQMFTHSKQGILWLSSSRTAELCWDVHCSPLWVLLLVSLSACWLDCNHSRTAAPASHSLHFLINQIVGGSILASTEWAVSGSLLSCTRWINCSLLQSSWFPLECAKLPASLLLHS